MPLHERRKRLEILLSGNDAIWLNVEVQAEAPSSEAASPLIALSRITRNDTMVIGSSLTSK
jgi:hypothetical protein